MEEGKENKAKDCRVHSIMWSFVSSLLDKIRIGFEAYPFAQYDNKLNKK